MPVREMTDVDQFLSKTVREAINHASDNTDRSKQQQDFRLGVSNIGHCRQYARYLMLQTAPTDYRDKNAAFFGTIAGEAIEQQIIESHPDWMVQGEIVFNIPSGGTMLGHYDIAIPADDETGRPQILADLKSKAELETVRRYGQSTQQRFQLHMYAKALMDEGIFDPTKPTYVANIFFDRSGKDPVPYVIGDEFDPTVIEHIDEWINDVKYAVLQGEDAPRDMPREWCWNWCEYASLCRGNDTDVEGLIEDPEVLAAVEAYTEATAMESQAKKMKNSAKIVLNRIDGGSTGEHTVRWVEVGPSQVSFTRDAYRKLDIRRIRKGK